jgi:hypothetical protein
MTANNIDENSIASCWAKISLFTAVMMGLTQSFSVETYSLSLSLSLYLCSVSRYIH